MYNKQKNNRQKLLATKNLDINKKKEDSFYLKTDNYFSSEPMIGSRYLKTENFQIREDVLPSILESKLESTDLKKQRFFNPISLRKFIDYRTKNDFSSSFCKIPSLLKSSTGSFSYKKIHENLKMFASNKPKELSVDKFLDLERCIISLTSNLKMPDEFKGKCFDWLNIFEEKIINEINFCLNNNQELKQREDEIQFKYNFNLLIMSITIAEWKIILYKENDRVFTMENVIKEVSELMITHQKLYLLLCLIILITFNKINSNDSDVCLLLEEIKQNLPKKIWKKNNLNMIIDELKATNQLLLSSLKLVMIDYNGFFDDLIGQNLNNISNLDFFVLIDSFKKLQNKNTQNSNNITDLKLAINKNESLTNRSPSPSRFVSVLDSQINNSMNNSNIKKEFSKSFSRNLIRKPTNNQEILETDEKNDYKTNFSNQNKEEKNNLYYIRLNKYKSENLINQEKAKDYSTRKEFVLPKEKPKPPYLHSTARNPKTNIKKYTLILDLDETLVNFQADRENKMKGTVLFRPGLLQFLNKVYPLFDLVVWTVATQDYADTIIDQIEKDKKYFIARLYRDHATIINGLFVKDLANLGRPLDKIIIIDDKESSFSLQSSNGILIRPFFGSIWECENDYVLQHLFTILTKIILDKSNDVRIGINKYRYEISQKISKVVKEPNGKTLIKKSAYSVLRPHNKIHFFRNKK